MLPSINLNFKFIIPSYLDVSFLNYSFVFLFRPHLKDVYYHFVLNEVSLSDVIKKTKALPHNFEKGWADFLTFEAHVNLGSQSVFGKEDCCFVDKYKLFNLVLEFYSRRT
jgi:hypothetical protein